MEYGAVQNTNPTFSILETEILISPFVFLLNFTGKINWIC